MWNGMYQDWYEGVKMMVKKDACMKFYNASRCLYLEINASGVGLGTSLFTGKG